MAGLTRWLLRPFLRGFGRKWPKCRLSFDASVGSIPAKNDQSLSGRSKQRNVLEEKEDGKV